MGLIGRAQRPVMEGPVVKVFSSSMGGRGIRRKTSKDQNLVFEVASGRLN